MMADTSEQRYQEPQETDDEITLRSLVSTKEAGIIIGKGGKNVSDLRDETGVKAGVSKMIHGVHERILSVSGPVDRVAKAFSVIAGHLIENQTGAPLSAAQSQHADAQGEDGATIKLLVDTHLMGSIIGRGGLKIRDIQSQSGAKIIIGKEMLAQSTERVVEIYGITDSIQIAVQLIAEACQEDEEKAAGLIAYIPQRQSAERFSSTGAPSPVRAKRASKPRTDDPAPFKPEQDQEGMETRSVPIHIGLVGCIIGKGGEFINNIRSQSGSRVSISKFADPGTNQRTFSTQGSKEGNDVALSMLFDQLELEKERRLTAAEDEEADAE